MISDDLKNRIKRLKVIILDIDGVLTDGRIILGNYGDELKFFDVQDGFGLVLLRRAGLVTVIISAKKSRINHRRAKDMKIALIIQNAHDKRKAYEKVIKKFKAAPEEVCFIGDDLLDLPVMSRVGVAVAVRNAVQEVRDKANYVTEKLGGRGAVREVADLILKTQNKWNEVTGKYFE